MGGILDALKDVCSKLQPAATFLRFLGDFEPGSPLLGQGGERLRDLLVPAFAEGLIEGFEKRGEGG